MSRLLPAALVLVAVAFAAALAVVLLTREGEAPYEVRAIFDNAGFVIPGEDVKVAGVKVGRIDALDVTEDFKAVVVLEITDEAYQDFRRDAECTIRPQSLIGERFVECEPTQARQATAAEAPALERIADGPGEGQFLLGVENTSKPVDLDLINNITREPQRARLAIVLSELGTAVAGRGGDLNAVIRRANPALKEIDEVLEILAAENDTLERLAVDGDTVLAPLARERRRVSSAIGNSAEVAEATAERRGDLEADIQRLPPFLRELRPTMARLGAFADQATPVLDDLGAQAPAINRFVTELGPFSRAGIPALQSLGDAAQVGTPAVQAARPVIGDLRSLSRELRPVGRTAAALLGSLRETGGFERFLDYVFYQVAAVNGFDSFGHYLRAGLIVNQCSTYAVEPTPGCTANFAPAGGVSAASAGVDGARDPVLQATADAIAAAMAGEPAPRLQATPTSSPAPAPSATPEPAPVSTAAPAPVSTPAPAGSAEEPLLDYLFGKDPG